MKKLLMNHKEKAVLHEVDWHTVRSDVQAVNPELAAIIDAIDPGKQFKLM